MTRLRYTPTTVPSRDQPYLKTFMQVVMLQRQGVSSTQTAQLLQLGHSLVQKYLAVYDQNDHPESR
jgi:hypothetical protein